MLWMMLAMTSPEHAAHAVQLRLSETQVLETIGGRVRKEKRPTQIRAQKPKTRHYGGTLNESSSAV
jgi:hypothetical protein